MIQVDYRRWGIFRSNMVLFAEQLPAMAGYHFAICEHSLKKLPDHPLFIPRESQSVVIDLSKDPEALLKRMKASRRQDIKYGLKMGYQITHQKATLELLQDFRTLYNQIIVGKGATPLVNLNYFKTLMPYMTITQANYAGRTLMISIAVHDDQTVRGFYQVRDESSKSKALNYIGSVVQWEIMRHFNGLGHTIYDLGAVNERLKPYKLSLGGEIIPHYSYDVALTPLARLALKARKSLERKIRKAAHRNYESPGQIIKAAP